MRSAKEIEIYHRQLKKQMDVDQEIKYEQLVRKLMQNISSDLPTVLQKVREENSLERKKMKEKMENEIIDLRYQIESKIRNMKSTEAT